MASLTQHFQVSSENNATMRMLQICSMIEATGIQQSFRVLFNTRIYADKLAFPFRFKTHVIPNGIPLDCIRQIEVPAEFKLPGRPEAKKLVFIGRLTVTKNVITVLDASIPDNVDFIIIGSDTQGAEPCVLETIQRIANERPNVFYVGGKYDEEKFHYLKSADAIIMPSIHEPFGIVALEALASGTVLLASMVDGMAEFLDDTVCIPCGVSPDFITAAVNKWNHMEIHQTTQLIQNGYNRAQQFSWDRVALQLSTQVYTDILSKK
jgi:glycosyltransferase involved in cell wall biosynthesis